MTTRILHVVNVPFVIKYYFGDQFRYLSQRTGNTYYLASSPSEELYQLAGTYHYSPLGVQINRSISPLVDLIAIITLYRFIRKHNITAVVGHTPKGGLLAMIAAWLAGTRQRIYFRHGLSYETSRGLTRFILRSVEKINGHLAHTVVCVSQAVRAGSDRDALNDPSKNIILGKGTCNGVDSKVKFNPDRFSPAQILATKERLNIDPNAKVVGFVGRLVKDKGVEELVQAWDRIRADHDQVHLVLVGPFEARDAISEATKQAILNTPSITVLGLVEDTSALYAIFDLFILPTYREGFPTVVLEASAMAKPVLVTRATGCTESIIDGQTGLFIEHDPVDIAKKIDYLLRNEDIRIDMGKKGQTFVRDHFEQTYIWEEIHTKLDI